MVSKLNLIAKFGHRASSILQSQRNYSLPCSRNSPNSSILFSSLEINLHPTKRLHKVKNCRLLHSIRYAPTVSSTTVPWSVSPVLQSDSKLWQDQTMSRSFTCLCQSEKHNKSAYSVTVLDKKESLFNHVPPQQKRNHYEDKKTTDLTVWGNLKEIKSSPTPALTLGFGGLVPFIGAPMYMMATDAFLPSLAFAQLAYGACILSFIGGVRWGMTIPEKSYINPDWRNLGYSVVPSLVAWSALMLPSPTDIFLVMAGLASACYFDMTSWAYPAWFKGLRFTLTCVAILSLWTTFVFRYLLHEKKNTDEPKEITE